MTLPTIEQARSWRGMTLVATDDEPVGRIEAIYVDRSTRQPEWALLHTGLFGSSRTFVPLADAAQRGDTVQVPHETSVVREAPRLEQDAELSEEDEARLYAHYGIEYTTAASSSGLPAGEAVRSGAPATETTAAEIWEQTGGRITHFITGLGTSGTFVGVVRRLRELNPALRAVAVQPESPLHGLEGLKHMATALTPGIFNQSLVSQTLEVSTEDALLMTQRLAREEGLFVGPSSGANVLAAWRLAASLRPPSVVVTVLCDGGDRYL